VSARRLQLHTDVLAQAQLLQRRQACEGGVAAAAPAPVDAAVTVTATARAPAAPGTPADAAVNVVLSASAARAAHAPAAKAKADAAEEATPPAPDSAEAGEMAGQQSATPACRGLPTDPAGRPDPSLKPCAEGPSTPRPSPGAAPDRCGSSDTEAAAPGNVAAHGAAGAAEQLACGDGAAAAPPAAVQITPTKRAEASGGGAHASSMRV